MFPEIATLETLLRDVAREELLPRFARAQRSVKPDGSIVTEADLAVQERLAGELRKLTPDVEVLGEEMSRDEQESLVARAGAGLWCLDPLDGTSNFAAGIPFFSISLALIREGGSVLGLVYDPVRGECFVASAGEGAWVNGERLLPRRVGLSLRRCIAVVDFKRLDRALRRRLVDEPPFSSQRNFGSTALEWCWLAAGRYHLYLHGGQKLWDYAAGMLILAEAGGRATRLAREVSVAADMGVRSAVAALDPELFGQWVAWLGAMPGEE
ncbi:inositol monophosphatase family protein [Methylococcus capsulatus]|uniref:Inositol monophosphatase family protein n=1 Tax=Methylococcus capsulatus (strain ATCC 33009 / NCIMB 11132 / Bath) TaxID=243233 RepID=Q604R6_METCA|nr:inositol monophosphatase family protein [Methylococcus capsulatus]AAU91415.1 inositol monophosphatase family protein [Methylococcus capsulatus str. Bath]QXP86958.1 inositol monophosphatase family protein [Methylococcus capsulatus]QXP93362.1 inositol monophosphatase family protein [Methylococcus capsulatus]UQN11939.1 inositol monophosphatase family protein [Methylococcus capsulatus]